MCAIAEDVATYLLDTSSFRRGPRLAMGAPHAANSAYLTQVHAGVGDVRARLFLKFAMAAGSAGNVSFRLRRSSDGASASCRSAISGCTEVAITPAPNLSGRDPGGIT